MIYSDPRWDQIPISDLNGILMIIGDTDTGKTTFARYLFKRLTFENPGMAIYFLDGDPGQSYLGPPTTITLTNNLNITNQSHHPNLTRRYFIGSISPRGHMLQMIIGTSKLIKTIPNLEKSIVIHDTTGFVNPALGGFALKSGMIDLLQPSTLFVFQSANELAKLVFPYKLSGRVKLVELSVSGCISRRDRENRKNYRQRQYQDYFSKVYQYELAWDKTATFPFPDLEIYKLIAFEDQFGFTLDLGIIKTIDRSRMVINVISPISSLDRVNALRIGDVSLNPETFYDKLDAKDT